MGDDIEKIFERERQIKEAMIAGRPVIDMPPQFRPEQLGLVPVYGDSFGQLWTIVGDKLLLVLESSGEPNGWTDK